MMQGPIGIAGVEWTRDRYSHEFPTGQLENECETGCAASSIYGEMRCTLRGYVQSLGLESEIEDVIQETFCRLLGRLRRRDRIEDIRAWIFQAANSIAMDIHRRQSGACILQLDEAAHLQVHADRRSSPEWMYSQKEKVEQIRSTMSRLTKRQLRSVQLRIRGLSYRAIAADLAVSEPRATYLVKRALERLGEDS